MGALSDRKPGAGTVSALERRVAAVSMASSTSAMSRVRAIPWAIVWEVGRSLWQNARDRVSQNLSAGERREFARIVRNRQGRPWNLDARDRRDLLELVKKAATGSLNSGWDEVSRSLVTLLPPRLLTAIWERRSRR